MQAGEDEIKRLYGISDKVVSSHPRSKDGSICDRCTSKRKAEWMALRCKWFVFVVVTREIVTWQPASQEQSLHQDPNSRARTKQPSSKLQSTRVIATHHHTSFFSFLGLFPSSNLAGV